MSYAGDITPEEAWKTLSEEADAVLVDVRTSAEWKFVGLPDLSSLGRKPVCVEWNHTDGRRNEDFLAELNAGLDAAGVSPGAGPVLFLCRSGNRSIGAATLATEAGLVPSFNILDGFEGDLDEFKHRGAAGWRAIGLPWIQS